MIFKHTALITILAFSIITTSANSSFCAEGDGITIDTFKPSTSVNSIFKTTLPATKEHLKWSAGGLLHYAHKPLRKEHKNYVDDTVIHTNVISERLQLDLSAAAGLWNIFEVGLALPLIVQQNGEGIDNSGVQPSGFGDPRLEIKAIFIDTASWSAGVFLITSFPLGHYLSSGNDMMGQSSMSVTPGLTGQFNKGRFLIAINGGFAIRPEATLANYHQTHYILASAAAGYDIKEFSEPGGLRLAVEFNTQTGTRFSNLAETPLELLFGVKYRSKKDYIFTGGAGGGISNAVGTPLYRIFFGLAFDSVNRSCDAGEEDYDGFEDDDNCLDPDNDNDKILDVDDKCPNDAEDYDGFEDDDGCPEPDNDQDSIWDVVDECPMIPEDFDDFEDSDGCPEEGPGKATVKITDSQLLLSSKIYFDFDKTTIKKISYTLLDVVADALAKNKAIKKVVIEGHTDNEGTIEYNLELSEKRAESVMKYLIGKGVDEKRLTYKGYGFSRPKASNRSEEGKSINRRVEFKILKRD